MKQNVGDGMGFFSRIEESFERRWSKIPAEFRWILGVIAFPFALLFAALYLFFVVSSGWWMTIILGIILMFLDLRHERRGKEWGFFTKTVFVAFVFCGGWFLAGL